MTLRTTSKYVAAALVLALGLAGGSAMAPAAAKPKPATPAETLIPHCLAEDGGPQPVCIWDSAVNGNGQPAAPNNVVILYVTRAGQDPQALRLK